MLIHYKGFHTKFDEWINRNNAALRIRPYGPHKVVHRPAVGEAVPSTTQKQWRVPGALVARPSVPGRHNPEIKDKIKIKMPGMAASSSSSLPAIGSNKTNSANGAENEDPGAFSDNQLTHEETAESRTRRITTLSEQYAQYTRVLAQQGLHIEAVEGDGNCLFRAVAHQVYGDENLHNLVRQKCLDYMESESDFFSQFVEGGREMFPFYLRAKRMDACWGDDPEIEVLICVFTFIIILVVGMHFAFQIPFLVQYYLKKLYDEQFGVGYSLSIALHTVPKCCTP